MPSYLQFHCNSSDDVKRSNVSLKENKPDGVNPNSNHIDYYVRKNEGKILWFSADCTNVTQTSAFKLKGKGAKFTYTEPINLYSMASESLNLKSTSWPKELLLGQLKVLILLSNSKTLLDYVTK